MLKHVGIFFTLSVKRITNKNNYFNSYIISPTTVYYRYKVYQLTIENYEQASILPTLRENVNYDFFTETMALNSPIHVMVEPNSQAEFINTLKANGVKYTIVDENVER